MITIIFIEDGTLTFEGRTVASKNNYLAADRCVGSIFEALHGGESILLSEGIFFLDEELDLVETVTIKKDQYEYTVLNGERYIDLLEKTESLGLML